MHQFNLIENAKDSLEHAIAHMASAEGDAPGEWKRAILDLSHVVELLLKEKLRQVHPAFVFGNIDKFPSANAFTVSAEIASSRVQNICGVQFTKEDLVMMKAIREKRNEIEHYEFEIKGNEAAILIGGVLSFILRFSSDELGLNWRDEQLLLSSWQKLMKYTEFYREQLSYIKKKIQNNGIYVIECTICYNETFDVEEEVCLLCGHQEEVLECKWCKEPYLYSAVEYEDAGLCKSCEWKEGYAAANYEKY